MVEGLCPLADRFLVARLRGREASIRRRGRLIPLVEELLNLLLKNVNYGVYVGEFVFWIPLAHNFFAFVYLSLKILERPELVFHYLTRVVSTCLGKFNLLFHFEALALGVVAQRDNIFNNELVDFPIKF